jgi:long-chain fatty acid transport protein
MKKIVTVASTIALMAGAASASGISKGGNAYNTLFESGNYVEFSFSSVKPSVSGEYPAGFGGGSTGNMALKYTNAALSYKNQLSETLALGFYINQPYAAHAQYTGGAYDGLKATWESTQIAAVLKYQASDAVSVFGGIRYIESSAVIAIPGILASGGAVAGPTFDFTAESDTDGQISYVGGIAYEKPEIALRVRLTYESAYTHKFKTRENSVGFGLTNFDGVTEVEMPQTVMLDAQSGIAKDTLLFGSIRWTEWSKWQVFTPGFTTATGNRVTGYDNDVVTYQLGIGRRFTENFSGFARITFEEANGGIAPTRLDPTDGRTSLGIGGSYTSGAMKITGGIEYVQVGDTQDASGLLFTDNDAVGLGITVGYSF